MDMKRVESSSSPLTNTSSSKESVAGSVKSIETNVYPGHLHETHVIQEYGPFPGEVAYPPETLLSPGTTFPPLTNEYPQIFYLPMHLVHENFAKTVEDVTKLKIDVETTDDGIPSTNRSNDDSLAVDAEYRYPLLPYPMYPYGYGYGYMYPRPFIGGYIGSVPIYPPFFW
ncbi:hypothetical protein LSG31_20720 [Fodinisporobacter ferrooxydans]|uniref:Spore coat protein n=1 Tax=Fodinisporobacter ferrooxydans TaxID=2901836 RepID=A0ABY4CIA7_9BACL|nr:hypothetical protein LSG31_20720 [Alicyclobacillaceae bacterium MYW30-H2]